MPTPTEGEMTPPKRSLTLRTSCGETPQKAYPQFTPLALNNCTFNMPYWAILGLFWAMLGGLGRMVGFMVGCFSKGPTMQPTIRHLGAMGAGVPFS